MASKKGVRITITLECTECRSNPSKRSRGVSRYTTTKNRRNTTGRMNELCQTLGDILQRPSWLPVPSFALELLLGDGAKVVLEGQQVLPKATQAAGFQYQYSTLKPALQNIVARS